MGFLFSGLTSCNENKILSLLRELTEVVVENSESLSDNSYCAVSYNRITDFLTSNDTASVTTALILPEIADESVIYAGFAFFEQESELAVVLDTEKSSGKFSHGFLSMLSSFCP